jgi:hypothetical protein
VCLDVVEEEFSSSLCISSYFLGCEMSQKCSSATRNDILSYLLLLMFGQHREYILPDIYIFIIQRINILSK